MKGKRGLAIILTLSMLMYLLTGFGPAVMAADARFAAEKPFEAENGKLSGAMKKTKDTGASGGYFISVTEGARVDEPAKMQPEASYVFTVPVDGEYQFWTKSYMKDIKAIAYCNSEEYVYYITFGDLEGIHRMLSDGSEDILIRNLDGIDITANTSVTMEYKGTSIIFIMQELSQTDENGIAEKEYPVYKYELNLADNSLKKL